jgi:hypothetical protein
MNSKTWGNDHLPTATTILEFHLHNINLPLNNNDHLSSTATNLGSRGWSLYTSLTVVAINQRLYDMILNLVIYICFIVRFGCLSLLYVSKISLFKINVEIIQWLNNIDVLIYSYNHISIMVTITKIHLGYDLQTLYDFNYV